MFGRRWALIGRRAAEEGGAAARRYPEILLQLMSQRVFVRPAPRRSCRRWRGNPCHRGCMDLDVLYVSQRRRRAMGSRRGGFGGARRGGAPRGDAIAVVGETVLGRSSGLAGGSCHASRSDVAAASARSHAVLGAKASDSLCSALVAGGAPDCSGLEYSRH